MIYNIISAIGFALVVGLHFLLKKFKYLDKVIRGISAAVFIYKSAFYISENIKGNVCIPVEISTISYFMIPVILTFKIKGLYGVAAFFGCVAGLGYFAAYIPLGFWAAASFTVKEVIIGCFCHGYLLLTGAYLLESYALDKRKSKDIWITLLAMLCWALVFYDSTRSLTFVYLVVKPEFLQVFSSSVINFFVTIAYYEAWGTAFYFGVKLFYKLNARLRLKRAAVAAVREGERSAA